MDLISFSILILIVKLIIFFYLLFKIFINFNFLDPKHTNLPNQRHVYRLEAMLDELKWLMKYL